MYEEHYQNAIDLLKTLISNPSFSKEEAKTADVIEVFLQRHKVKTNRKEHNIWAINKHFSPDKPTILLNSHHDTVKPNSGYTLDPFEAIEKDGRLYGLGSNDAGGPLVSLIAAFLHFYEHEDLKYNLLIAATAEEEISGKNGIELIYNDLPVIDFAIVGEPTRMQLAVAEKGLMVLDCTTYGQAGHAAREEGENAIYKALQAIEWFRTYRFARISEHLGQVKMSVTIINAGSQHNVIPDQCRFTVDVRTTDVYSNAEVLKTICQHVNCEVVPRSLRLNSSFIDEDHPLVQAGKELGLETYGSPTTSDQALIPTASVKAGPGDSARSHTADEFIGLDEIKEGIELYCKLLGKVIC